MLGGVGNVGRQRKAVVASVREPTQIVVEQESIRPTDCKPPGGERENQEDIESGKDAENAANVEVPYRYISGALRLVEHHPGNQEAAEDEEGQDAPAFRNKGNVQVVGNDKKDGDRAQAVERWDLPLAEAGTQSGV